MMKKGKSVLEELFYGEIFPAETVMPQNPDYRRVSQLINTEQKALAGILGSKDQERLKELDALYLELLICQSVSYFSAGFKLGARMLTEVFTDTNPDAGESLRRITESLTESSA